jgi:hypothetical protein
MIEKMTLLFTIESATAIISAGVAVLSLLVAAYKVTREKNDSKKKEENYKANLEWKDKQIVLKKQEIDLLKANSDMKHKTFLLNEKRDRVSKMPVFESYEGLGSGGKNFHFKLKNVGAKAYELFIEILKDEQKYFISKVTAIVDIGGVVKILGESYNGNGDRVTFNLRLNFKDIDGVQYCQNIYNVGNKVIVEVKPTELK